MNAPVLALLRREFAIARRTGGASTMGIVFLLVLVTLMPFALGPDLNLLARIGPAIIWFATLLASLLGLDRLFQADHEDGSLEVMGLGSLPLELVVLVKALAHWITTGLPIVIAAPIMGLMLAQDAAAIGGIVLSLLIGGPALTFLGAVGAALTVSLRRGGLLMALLVLPLCVPVLIFGVAAANAASGGPVPLLSPLAILAALSLLAGALCPFAAAAALRLASDH